MNGKRKTTIRLRLTVLYAGAFFLCGAILIAAVYLNVQQSLQHPPGTGMQETVGRFLGNRGPGDHPVADRIFAAVNEQAAQERAEMLRALLVRSLVALVVMGVAAAGLGWLLAGRVLHPLQQITATARRVADRSLHERIALDGPLDEIKDLADTFDAMLERLDRSFDGQRRFVANASHELRTPLAINRTLIEVALDDPDTPESTRQLGGTLLGVNARNERLIDGLLVLAGSQQQLDLRPGVDLAQIAQRAIETASPVAERSGVTIASQLQAVNVTGDLTLLERVAHNLIDNAVRYNLAEQGWVHVTVGAVGPLARLIVENSGSVIAPGDVDDLFEPFRRLPNSERLSDPRLGPGRGAGLGLSIVRSVVQGHRGEVEATAHTTGGLTVTVTIPLTR